VHDKGRYHSSHGHYVNLRIQTFPRTGLARNNFRMRHHGIPYNRISKQVNDRSLITFRSERGRAKPKVSISYAASFS
jgi:hypothetical protein